MPWVHGRRGDIVMAPSLLNKSLYKYAVNPHLLSSLTLLNVSLIFSFCSFYKNNVKLNEKRYGGSIPFENFFIESNPILYREEDSEVGVPAEIKES